MYYMFKVTKVHTKHSNELVYIGVISSLEASIPLDALRANYNPVEYSASVCGNALLFDKALEEIGKELKEYFDEKGCYPRDNQKIFENNYSTHVYQILQSFSNPIEINEQTILSNIQTGHTCGNYIYGHYEDSRFIEDYVGRCTDEELQERVKHRLDPDDNNYERFEDKKTSHVRYRYAVNEEEAIEIECLLYHWYGGKNRLINNVHPSLENNSHQCHVCDMVRKLININ